MEITILGQKYNISTIKLDLSNKNLESLPSEIWNLINLQILNLYNNKLESLPAEIGNLINLQGLYLENNQLKCLPTEILKIKEKVIINSTSYDIDNLDMDCEILLFSNLDYPLLNLPTSLKELWLKKVNMIKDINIKLPFNCVIRYY